MLMANSSSQESDTSQNDSDDEVDSDEPDDLLILKKLQTVKIKK